MAVIYLMHPIHGAKVAIAETEAVYDETLGWIRFDPELTREVAAATLPRTRTRRALDPATGVI